MIFLFFTLFLLFLRAWWLAIITFFILLLLNILIIFDRELLTRKLVLAHLILQYLLLSKLISPIYNFNIWVSKLHQKYKSKILSLIELSLDIGLSEKSTSTRRLSKETFKMVSLRHILFLAIITCSSFEQFVRSYKWLLSPILNRSNKYKFRLRSIATKFILGKPSNELKEQSTKYST